MSRPELRMSFADRATLGREFDANLRLGRAILPEPAALEVLSDCTLVLVHPDDGRDLSLPAQVVIYDKPLQSSASKQGLPYQIVLSRMPNVYISNCSEVGTTRLT